MDSITKEEWITVKEAAEALQVSERTIHRYTISGKLKCYQLVENGNKRILWSSIDAMLNEINKKGHR